MRLLYRICNAIVVMLRRMRIFLQNVLFRSSFKKMDGLVKLPHQLMGMQYISIGKGTKIFDGGILTAWDSFEDQHFTPSIEIGENCNIGEQCHITACNSIKIGNNVLTGRKVYISDNSHGTFDRALLDIHPLKRPLVSKGGVVIGDNVWICDNVCILSGVTIGNGAVVAANAVVTHDVPPYTMVAGVPAKVIKTLG